MHSIVAYIMFYFIRIYVLENVGLINPPYGHFYYFIADNKIWSKTPTLTVSIDQQYLKLNNGSCIIFKHDLFLHGKEVTVRLTVEGKTLEKRVYILKAFNFTLSFEPSFTELPLFDDFNVTCIPGPIDERISYEHAILSYIGSENFTRINNMSIKFHYSISLLKHSLCVLCSCLNYFNEQKCYIFNDRQPLIIRPEDMYIDYLTNAVISCSMHDSYSNEFDQNISLSVINVPNISFTRIEQHIIKILPHPSINVKIFCVKCSVLIYSTSKCYRLMSKIEKGSDSAQLWRINRSPNLEKYNVRYQNYKIHFTFVNDITNEIADPVCSCYNCYRRASFSINITNDFEFTIRHPPGSYQFHCNNIIYRLQYYLVIIISNEKIVVFISPKDRNLTFMDTTNISCIVSPSIYLPLINLTVKDNDIRYVTRLTNSQLQFIKSIDLINKIICCTCQSFTGIEDSKCYTLLYDKSPVIVPSYDILNYTFENIIYCDIFDPRVTSMYIVHLKGDNISATDYININTSTLQINPQSHLNEHIFCFNCVISILSTTKCYQFTGYYKIVVYPKAEVIYYEDHPLITCTTIIAATGIINKTHTITFEPSAKKFITELQNGSIKIQFEISRRCINICGFCDVDKLLFEVKCYSVRIKWIPAFTPVEAAYNVYYATLLIHLYFYSSLSPNKIDVYCIITNNVNWQIKNGNDFEFNKMIPPGKYIFSCSDILCNYTDKIGIDIIYKKLDISIVPANSTFYYMEHQRISCIAEEAYVNKYLNLSVDVNYRQYIIQIFNNVIEFVKDYSLRNHYICFLCNDIQLYVVKKCYTLKFDTIVQILPDLYEFNYSLKNYIYCTLLDPRSDINYNLTLEGYNISVTEYKKVNSSTIQILENMDLNLRVYCFRCHVIISATDRCYYFKGYFITRIEPTTDIIYFMNNSILTCRIYVAHNNAAYGIETLLVPNTLAQYYTVLSNKSIEFKPTIDLNCLKICVKCIKDLQEITKCYTFVANMKPQYSPVEAIYNVYYTIFVIKFSFNSTLSNLSIDTTCTITNNVNWRKKVGNKFEFGNDTPTGTYIFRCTVENCNNIDTIGIDILNQKLDANILPKSRNLSFMENHKIKCISTATYVNKYLQLSVEQNYSKYIIQISNNELEFKNEPTLRLKRICCFCRDPYEQVGEQCYTLISDAFFDIIPNQYTLNYSFQNQIYCILLNPKMEGRYTLTLRAVNISATDNKEINATTIQIKLHSNLYLNVYCFSCYVVLSDITRCYLFTGYYRLQIEPITHTIYFMDDTVFTCYKYVAFNNNQEGTSSLSVLNMAPEYYTILSNQSVVFKYNINLQCRNICLKCVFKDLEDSKCYTFIAKMTLKVEPWYMRYNVYYMTSKIHFSFKTHKSDNLFKASCNFLNGSDWKTYKGNDFLLTKDTNVNNYTVSCTMINCNYSSNMIIEVLNQPESATITPFSGNIRFMDNITITCLAEKKYFQKYLLLMVKKIDLPHVIYISANQFQFKKQLSSKNKQICFYCVAEKQYLDEACFNLRFHVDFKYTPQRKVYYLFRNSYILYPTYYDERNNLALATKCHCTVCPKEIEIGLKVTITVPVPDGTYTIFCHSPTYDFHNSFQIITSHEPINLLITPVERVIYTSVVNDITCTYNLSRFIVDNDMDFPVFYPDSKAFSKISNTVFRLIKDIKYHNTTICFSCNLDSTQSTKRCYLWKGFPKFCRQPFDYLYFNLPMSVIEVYYVDLNNTSTKRAAICSRVLGPSEVIQSNNYMAIILTKMLNGLYTILCKMKFINQYDYFNISLESPRRLILKSSLYPDKYNASQTLLLPGEEITFKLLYEDKFPGIKLEWKHYHGLTSATNSTQLRQQKNSVLSIHNNKLKILKEVDYFGYDFTIYCSMSFYGKIDLLNNYTIAKIVDIIFINISFYVNFLSTVNYDSNGFPKDYLLYKLSIRDQTVCEFSYAKVCRIPTFDSIGMVKAVVTVSQSFSDSLNFEQYAIARISLRVFDKFQWKQPFKLIYYNSDILMCEANMTVPFTTSISQISGQSNFDSVHSNYIRIRNIIPGIYKLVCIVKISNENLAFIRVKVLHIYSNYNKICFLPFAPVLGMLIKCITTQYPVKGNYHTILTETKSKLPIVSNDKNTLRIPYVLSINKEYKIMCQYSVDENIQKVSRNFFINDSFIVVLFKESKDCSIPETLPQEYQLQSDTKGYLYINNRFYYLKDEKLRAHNFLFFLFLSYFFQYFCIALQYFERQSKSHFEQLDDVQTYNDTLMKRHIVRKVSDKIQRTMKFQMIGAPPAELSRSYLQATLISFWKKFIIFIIAIRTFIVRCMFILYASIGIWNVVIEKSSIYWLLLITIIPLFIETFIGIYQIKMSDSAKLSSSKWFSPVVALFLLSACPPIWIMEITICTQQSGVITNNYTSLPFIAMNKTPSMIRATQNSTIQPNVTQNVLLNASMIMTNQTKILNKIESNNTVFGAINVFNATNEYGNITEVFRQWNDTDNTTTLSPDLTMFNENNKTMLKNNSNIAHQLNTEATVAMNSSIETMWSKYDIQSRVTILEQILLLNLILCRWILPRGGITRDQLSQLLLVNIGMSADILELFEAMKEPFVRNNFILNLIILVLWQMSLIQFSLTKTVTKARKIRMGFYEDYPSTTKSESKLQLTNCICCQTELWAIATSLLLQDIPFFCLRMTLIFHFKVLSYSNIFFTSKNTLVILLQLFRSYVILCEAGNKDKELGSAVSKQSIASVTAPRWNQMQSHTESNFPSGCDKSRPLIPERYEEKKNGGEYRNMSAMLPRASPELSITSMDHSRSNSQMFSVQSDHN